MAKITDFKIGDIVRRKSWDNGETWSIIDGKHLDYYTVTFNDLLADDWEKEKRLVKKQGWIAISKRITSETHNCDVKATNIFFDKRYLNYVDTLNWTIQQITVEVEE